VLRLLDVNQSDDPETPTTDSLTFSSYLPGYFRLGWIFQKSSICNLRSVKSLRYSVQLSCQRCRLDQI